MVKVDNKDVLRELTSSFMKANRRRNRIALAAVVLTCLLFTTLFTGTVSIILTKRAVDVKAFRVSAHAFAQDLTREEWEKSLQALKKNRDVDVFGTGVFLGSGMDPRFGFLAEVRYGDEKTAESFSSVPTTGRLPENWDEIAVGTMTLDALGLPHKLGTPVTITYERGPGEEEMQTDTFRLSGYWISDKGVVGQMLWVSEDYARENAHPITREELEAGVRNGGRDLVAWYKNSWFPGEKTRKLSKDSGVAFSVNPAYDLMEEDAFSFGTVAAMAFLIILAGYLIIYNIFSISVKSDLKVYGLLKNIGATGKQMKRIVYRQVARLTLQGVPLGLLGGFLAGAAMAPSLNVDLDKAAEGSDAVCAVVSANPLIFIVSAALTLATVYLSVMQSCRLVERVSPMEALRMAQSEISYKKTWRMGGGCGWFSMAVQNVFANLGRSCMVMFSIALSLAMMDCMVMLVQGYDFETYKKIVLASDFKLDQMAATLQDANFSGIRPEMKERLEACPNEISIGYVYCQKAALEMDEDFKEKWRKWSDYYRDGWDAYQKDLWQETYEKGELPVHYIGVNAAVFEKLEWEKGSCSWEQFQKDGRALINYGARYRGHPFSCQREGDKVCVQLEGKAKTYTVGGEAYLPYSMDYPYTELYAATIILPESEFIRSAGNESAMFASVDCESKERKEVKKYIETAVIKENWLLHMTSALDLEEGFQKIVGRYYVIGGMMVAILALIGVMNFFNVVATSVISRKRELALLEAVGMTRRQMMKMLAAKGCIYLVGAEIIALGLVCACAQGLLERTLGKAFFFQAHLVWWPCLALLPAFLAVVYGICRGQFKKMVQESVVERLNDL